MAGTAPTYDAQLGTRQFARLPVAPPNLVVERMSWHAHGGPELAVLASSGNERAVWPLLDLVRCPVLIAPSTQDPCWWGYVAGVEIAVGSITVGVTLDTLANRVAVVYSLANASSSSRQRTTPWLDDLDSQTEYGVKETRVALANVGTAFAEHQRAAYLAVHRLPPATWEWNGGGGGRSERDELRATITCRGWYDTLDWRYAARSAETTADTTAHISRLAASYGQFLAGIDVVDASNVVDRWHSAGDTTPKDEIDRLLALGAANEERMLLTVTKERVLQIARAPAAPANGDLRMDRHGALWNAWNEPLPLHTPVAGRWLRLKDIPAGGALLNHAVQPLPRLIRRAEFNVAQNRLLVEPWERRAPWETNR